MRSAPPLGPALHVPFSSSLGGRSGGAAPAPAPSMPQQPRAHGEGGLLAWASKGSPPFPKAVLLSISWLNPFWEAPCKKGQTPARPTPTVSTVHCQGEGAPGPRRTRCATTASLKGRGLPGSCARGGASTCQHFCQQRRASRACPPLSFSADQSCSRHLFQFQSAAQTWQRGCLMPPRPVKRERRGGTPLTFSALGTLPLGGHRGLRREAIPRPARMASWCRHPPESTWLRAALLGGPRWAKGNLRSAVAQPPHQPWCVSAPSKPSERKKRQMDRTETGKVYLCFYLYSQNLSKTKEIHINDSERQSRAQLATSRPSRQDAAGLTLVLK